MFFITLQVPVDKLYARSGRVKEGEEVAMDALVVGVLVALVDVAQHQLLEVLLNVQFSVVCLQITNSSLFSL